jgi:hypothetical protein
VARRVLPLLVTSNNADSCQRKRRHTPPLHETQDGGVHNPLTTRPQPTTIENERNCSFSWAVDSLASNTQPHQQSHHHRHHLSTIPPPSRIDNQRPSCPTQHRRDPPWQRYSRRSKNTGPPPSLETRDGRGIFYFILFSSNQSHPLLVT